MRMNNKEIILNAIAWQDVAAKVDVEPMQKLLGNFIRLVNYGEGVKQVVFTFIATPTSDIFHDNDASFDAKTGAIQMALRLSYEHVQSATKKRCWQMMASLVLVSLDLYDGLVITNFDLISFRDDLQNLFEQEGWLVPAKKL